MALHAFGITDDGLMVTRGAPGPAVRTDGLNPRSRRRPSWAIAILPATALIKAIWARLPLAMPTDCGGAFTLDGKTLTLARPDSPSRPDRL
jgi:hypothetical protein